MNLSVLLFLALLGISTQGPLLFGEISTSTTLSADPHHPEGEPKDPNTGLPKFDLHAEKSKEKEESALEKVDVSKPESVTAAIEEIFKDTEQARSKLKELSPEAQAALWSGMTPEQQSELLSKMSPEDQDSLYQLVEEKRQEAIKKYESAPEDFSAKKVAMNWDRLRSKIGELRQKRTPDPEDAVAAPAVPPAPVAGPEEVAKKIGSGIQLPDGRQIRPADVENIRAFLVEKEAGSSNFVYVNENGVTLDGTGNLAVNTAHGVRFHGEAARTADKTFTDSESGATYSVNAQTGKTEVADPRTRIISAVADESIPSGVSTVLAQKSGRTTRGSGPQGVGQLTSPAAKQNQSGGTSSAPAHRPSQGPAGWVCDGETCRPPSILDNNPMAKLLDEATTPEPSVTETPPEQAVSVCCNSAGNCGPCQDLFGRGLPTGSFTVPAAGSSTIPAGTNVVFQKFDRYQQSPVPVPSVVITDGKGRRTVISGRDRVAEALGQETINRIRRGPQ